MADPEQSGIGIAGRLGRQAALGLLWFYRNALSPLKPPCCRFEPTCSLYARDAIGRFGVLMGSWLALRRLLKCHPFYRGPLIDPVPEAGPAPAPHGHMQRQNQVR